MSLIIEEPKQIPYLYPHISLHSSSFSFFTPKSFPLSLSKTLTNNNNKKIHHHPSRNHKDKMMVDKDQDLGLSLSLASTAATHRHHQHPFALQLSLMPSGASPFAHHHHHKSSPWTDILAAPSGERGLRGIDVNRAPAAERENEEEAGASSPNTSTVSSVSGKRGSERDLQNGEENDMERACSRGISDEEDGEGSRKKLRLSKDQSAILEESFKEHNTLNPKQKQALAKQLNLRPRQVEVWFQNRRARTKLKQTEVDCEFLKRCCENLTEENRRLQKEVQELRALKLSPQFYMHMTPPTTLTMCPSCERVSSSSAAATSAQQQPRPIAAAPAPWAPIPLRASFLDAAPPQRS